MHTQVAIVGAGPAGALLSLILSSRGIDTLLLERQSDFSREFRGEFLMPSGVRALDSAGFDLSEVATRAPSVVHAYINRRPFLTFRLDDVAARDRPTAVSQPQLLERLVELAQATGHCEFRRGTTVRRIERDADDTHALLVRSEAGDGDETIRVPYVIGSDGRGSVCRRSFAPRVRTRGTPMDVVWFKLPYPQEWPEPGARIELGSGRLMIVLPSADGLLQMAWVIAKGSYGDLKRRSVAEWADEMARHTDPELADHLRKHREALSRPFLLRAVADRVRGWAAPGSLLIGDAAHTMSPVGAQGINLALRDAIVAANELVPAFRKGTGVDEAAARIEKLRAPEIDQIQRMAAIAPRIVLGRTPIHEGLRRLLAFVAPRAIERAGASVLGVAFNGVTDVELTV